MPRKDYRTLNEEKEPYEIVLEGDPLYDDDGEPVLDEDGRHLKGERIVVLPKQLPAKVLMDLRFKKLDLEDPDDEESQQEAENFGFKIVETLFGQEDWDAFISQVGIEAIPELAVDVLDYYGYGKVEGDEGEEEAPKATKKKARSRSGSTTSSKSGARSTQTSKGTTRGSAKSSTKAR